jgi:hypothetical protein
MNNNFLFEEVNIEDSFVIRISKGIVSKNELLGILAEKGKFPNYFGSNWDALLDFLRDFSWINEKNIVVFHEDLPLGDDYDQCRTYLEVLQQAIIDWREGSASFENADLKRHGHPYIEHVLWIVFPEAFGETIARIMR